MVIIDSRQSFLYLYCKMYSANSLNILALYLYPFCRHNLSYTGKSAFGIFQQPSILTWADYNKALNSKLPLTHCVPLVNFSACIVLQKCVNAQVIPNKGIRMMVELSLFGHH